MALKDKIEPVCQRPKSEFDNLVDAGEIQVEETDSGIIRYFIKDCKCNMTSKFGRWTCNLIDSDGSADVLQDMSEAALLNGICDAVEFSGDEYEDASFISFYISCDNLDKHRLIIKFMLNNNLIARSIRGRLLDKCFVPVVYDESAISASRDSIRKSIRLFELVDSFTGELKQDLDWENIVNRYLEFVSEIEFL